MTPDFSDKTATIHLDYGADSAAFDVGDLYVCSQGLRIKTRWSFALGTELSINFQLTEDAPDGGSRLLKTEGVVVECERDGMGDGYHVTMLFLEMTDDIQTIIRDMSVSLALPG